MGTDPTRQSGHALTPSGVAPGHELATRRLDIQGLRAFAVLAVVLFHARLPVPGGFIGVDVFFVISGFVITGMLHREWARNGRISIASFWRRRFMRLTPALALMVSVTILLAGLLLFPDEQRITVETGIGAMLLVANLVIARNTGGYFDAPAEANPLLNTWSLSVEEQFYLLFPLILVVIWVVVRRWRRLAVIDLVGVSLIAAGSFALAVFSHTAAGSAITWLNFYSPVVRAWEFAVGAVLALVVVRVTLRSRPLAESIGWIGLAGLVTSLFAISGDTPFPGVWTLLPVLSTALLILAGSVPATTVSRLLSVRPMVAVGDWSYSIYLWHWPIIALTAAIGLSAPPWLTLAAVASFVPALLSYRFVEQPLRTRSRLPRARFASVVAIVLSIPLLCSVVVLGLLRPTSLHPGEVGTEYLDYINATSYPCVLEQAPGNSSRCLQSHPDQPIDVALIGDSHAEHLYIGMKDLLPDVNVAYIYMPNWPFDTSDNTRLTIEQLAASPDVGTVVIGSRWTPDSATIPELKNTLDTLTSAGKEVFVADDGPYFSFPARECKYQRFLGPASRCSESAAAYLANRSAFLPLLEETVAGYPGARMLRTSTGFCDQLTCSMLSENDLLFADHGHLNELGSRAVVGRLLASDPAFASAVGARRS